LRGKNDDFCKLIIKIYLFFIYYSSVKMDHFVRFLLKYPFINAMQPDNGGRTPLHWAAASNHGATVTLLLQHPQIHVDKKIKQGSQH
jgi:ankyrin repeat protein